jgi:hypothetical protein
MKKPNWIKDLHFVFADLHCPYITPLSHKCPIIWLLSLSDIRTVYSRLELNHLIDEHLSCLRNAPQIGQEFRYLGSFSYGFTLNSRRKPKYTIYAFNWYFRNADVDDDAAGLIGIVPAGTESLVAAEVKEHLERSKTFQSADAIWSQLEVRPNLAPSN